MNRIGGIKFAKLNVTHSWTQVIEQFKENREEIFKILRNTKIINTETENKEVTISRIRGQISELSTSIQLKTSEIKDIGRVLKHEVLRIINPNIPTLETSKVRKLNATEIQILKESENVSMEVANELANRKFDKLCSQIVKIVEMSWDDPMFESEILMPILQSNIF